MIAALLDHIWQSTLFAVAIGVLTLAFRRNGAALRFWLWFAASVKFLVPFAALAALGEYLSRQYPAPVPHSIAALQPTAEKLSAPAKMLVASHADAVNWAPLLLGIWLAGLALILGVRLLRWLRLRAMMAQAHDLPVAAPIQVKASPGQGISFFARAGPGRYPATSGADARRLDGTSLRCGAGFHSGA
jgi:hypothetical protein